MQAARKQEAQGGPAAASPAFPRSPRQSLTRSARAILSPAPTMTACMFHLRRALLALLGGDLRREPRAHLRIDRRASISGGPRGTPIGGRLGKPRGPRALILLVGAQQPVGVAPRVGGRDRGRAGLVELCPQAVALGPAAWPAPAGSGARARRARLVAASRLPRAYAACACSRSRSSSGSMPPGAACGGRGAAVAVAAGTAPVAAGTAPAADEAALAAGTSADATAIGIASGARTMDGCAGGAPRRWSR